VNAEVGTRNGEQTNRPQPPRDLKDRTKAFALAIVRLVDDLPKSRAPDVIGRQLLRAATSVAANYRSARRARSRKEFLAKMGIVEEESDESSFWLELLLEAGIATSAKVAALRDEAKQLVAITIASIHTAREGGRPVPRSAFRLPR
jgi:four helix bundle protein